MYLNAVPEETTWIRWANLLQPKTREQFNQRIVQLALERKVTPGRKMRTDGTLVESHIRPPSDGRLLADSVWVLARNLARGRMLLQAAPQKFQEGFEALSQNAKGMARQIGESLRSRKAAARTAGRQQYQELLAMTAKSMDWAARTQKPLQKQSPRRAKRLAETLTHFRPLARQVIQPATRPILQAEQVPAAEKIVRILEAHTDIIRRGPEAKPLE